MKNVPSDVEALSAANGFAFDRAKIIIVVDEVSTRRRSRMRLGHEFRDASPSRHSRHER